MKRISTLANLQGKVLKIQSLGWEQDDEVKNLLKLAADVVAPVMKRHNWTISILKELSPKNKGNLLGYNQVGLKIVCVRIRQTSNPKGPLYSFSEIVSTLLHELVHFDIRPHNARFNRLFEQITLEAEADLTQSLLDNSSTSLTFSPSFSPSFSYGYQLAHDIDNNYNNYNNYNSLKELGLSAGQAAAIAAEKRMVKHVTSRTEK